MERGKESIRGCIYSAQCAACREKFKYLCWESFQSKSGLGNLYWRTIAPSIVFKHWCLSDVCLKNTQQSKECRLLWDFNIRAVLVLEIFQTKLEYLCWCYLDAHIQVLLKIILSVWRLFRVASICVIAVIVGHLLCPGMLI